MDKFPLPKYLTLYNLYWLYQPQYKHLYSYVNKRKFKIMTSRSCCGSQYSVTCARHTIPETPCHLKLATPSLVGLSIRLSTRSVTGGWFVYVAVKTETLHQYTVTCARHSIHEIPWHFTPTTPSTVGLSVGTVVLYLYCLWEWKMEAWGSKSLTL